MVYEKVIPFQGSLQESALYRATWPLQLKTEHNTAARVEWSNPELMEQIKERDHLVFFVDKIEKNQITSERLNITYRCRIKEVLPFLDTQKNKELSGKIIAAALPEAKSKNLKTELYEVTVTQDLSIVDGRFSPDYIVTFIEKNAPKDSLGNPGKIPGLEVYVDRKTLKVKKSHFIR